MKRILLLLHLPPPYNGVSVFNQNILRGSLAERFRLDVIGVNTAKRLEDIEHVSLYKFLALARSLVDLLGKLLRHRYCLCYFSLTPTGIGFYKDWVLVLLLKLFRVRRVYHLHGKGVSLVRGVIQDAFYRSCFNGAQVILLSRLLYYDIERFVPRDKVHFLANGIRPTLGQAEFEAIAAKPAPKPVRLLFLSNMIRSKGIFIALKTMQLLQSKGISAQLHFVGGWYDITLLEFMQEVAKAGIGNCVKYRGFKSGKEKAEELSRADIFIYPSLKDTFPLVLIEAMEFGLPVVSTREGAIPEIVQDNVTGFLVEKNDPGGLAERIEYLINHPRERLEMGRAARSRFLQLYTFDRVEDNLIDILDNIAGAEG